MAGRPNPILGEQSNRTYTCRSSSPENVLAEVLKQAENGDGIIVRVYEAFGRDTEALLEMPLLGLAHEFTIGRNEIKTFRITDSAVTETNLLEE